MSNAKRQNKSLEARTRSDVRRMSNAPRLFVRFKSQQCIHCENSQPGWNAMVKKLKGYTLAPGCVVGEIESRLANGFQGTNSDGTPFVVGGVPAYEFFENGMRKELPPPGRDANSLIQALERQSFLQKKRRSRRTRRLTF